MGIVHIMSCIMFRVKSTFALVAAGTGVALVLSGAFFWHESLFSSRKPSAMKHGTWDLSTPEAAFTLCRNAFRKGSTDRLRRCLSPRLNDKLSREGEDYIHLWQLGFSVCGGYGRKPVEIVESTEEAYMRFKPIEGCIDSIRMIRIEDTWHFDETGMRASP